MSSMRIPSVSGAGIVFAGLLCLLALYKLLRIVLSPLGSIPGPFLARFTRFWYLRHVWKGDFQNTNIRLHKKYGPIVRIAPNEYSIDSAEAIRTIYGHGTHFVKAPWYKAFEPITLERDPSLFTDPDPRRHAANRRKAASLYSMTSMLKWESCVDESTRALIAQFDKLSQSGGRINLQLWLQYYAFDSISLLTLGKSFGLVHEGQDKHGFIAALHQYLIYASNVGVYSEFHRYLGRLINLISTSGIDWMVTFVSTQFQERLAKVGPDNLATAKERDFLGTTLRLHAQQPDKLGLKDVFSMSLQNIGAGSDTTSVSLAGIMYNLSTSPLHMQRLRAELDEAEAQGKLSELTTFAEAQQLPFLQACIKEGLRMHPATGLPLARVVPKDGAVINGVRFPPGTVVGVNSWVAHANPDIFGSDAEVFRPERWLESKERSSMMESCFLSFGAGSRTCIGKNISLMEISKIVPELVRRFDFTLTNPDRPVEMENVWFVKQKDLYTYIQRRSTVR